MSRRALLFSLAVIGCAPSLEGNEPRDANKATPASFAREPASAPATASVAQRTWQDFFQSPNLRALIGEATKNNRELNIQLQEIVVAENEVSSRRGEYLPKVNAQAGAGVEKVGKKTSQGASDEAHGLPENLGNFTFGLTGTWEIDVWGKLRNATKAAYLRYLATVEGRSFMLTQIVAEIARSYYELVAIDRRLEILQTNVEVQTKALEVVKIEKLAARVTELAVQRFEGELLKNRSRRFDLEQERVQTENRINFLVGRFPQPVARRAEELDAPLPADLSAGLPSQLLANRPDVRRAELALEAAKLDVKVAKASFYPSLTIDAGVGYRAFNAEHLVATPDSLMYGAAAGLTAPLLNRAAITAAYRSANALQIQAVLEYEKTLIQAFTDVANQLAALQNLEKSYDLQEKQVEALTRSVEISNVLFQSARADYMEVLMVRRDSLDAQMELVETKRRQLETMVNLYQALGGGWRDVTDRATK